MSCLNEMSLIFLSDGLSTAFPVKKKAANKKKKFMISGGWRSSNRRIQARGQNLTVLVEHLQAEGLVEESKGHAVVAALANSPLGQSGGRREIIRTLVATLWFQRKKERNWQVQRGDVAVEVLGLSFQLVQFFDVLLILNLQFKRLSATREETKRTLKPNKDVTERQSIVTCEWKKQGPSHHHHHHHHHPVKSYLLHSHYNILHLPFTICQSHSDSFLFWKQKPTTLNISSSEITGE